LSWGKASVGCPGSERKKARTTLATTTERPAELDKETPSLSYVQDETQRKVSVHLKVKGQDDRKLHYKIKKTQALKKLMEAYCLPLRLKSECESTQTHALPQEESPCSAVHIFRSTVM
jgi:hypothetical protein